MEMNPTYPVCFIKTAQAKNSDIRTIGFLESAFCSFPFATHTYGLTFPLQVHVGATALSRLMYSVRAPTVILD